MSPMVRRLLPLLHTGLVLVPAVLGVLFLIEGLYEVPLREGSFRFEHPIGALALLGPLAVFAVRGFAARDARPRLAVSRGLDLARLPRGRKVWFADLPLALRVTALLLVAVALMGPQSIHAREQAEVQGIDIVLTLDMSRSMLAQDIEPTRFDAAKAVIADFITRRPNDRIGAVVFGREAYTLMPLTTDHTALGGVIEELAIDLIDGADTAIGNALGVSLTRLRRSTAKSKVVILLTDGESNAGNVSPTRAAELAAAMHVKVFTILMGRSSDAPVTVGVDPFGRPVRQVQRMQINPELLRQIASRTGGEHFQAADRRSLEQSFHTILDRLERSRIEDPGRIYGELYPAFVGPALLLLFVELLVGLLVLRRWP